MALRPTYQSYLQCEGWSKDTECIISPTKPPSQHLHPWDPLLDHSSLQVSLTSLLTWAFFWKWKQIPSHVYRLHHLPKWYLPSQQPCSISQTSGHLAMQQLLSSHLTHMIHPITGWILAQMGKSNTQLNCSEITKKANHKDSSSA